MGSTGSGTFSDYSQRPSASGMANGGTSGEDRCAKAFNTQLEEVTRCSYFKNNGSVPPAGTELTVEFSQRLTVQTLQGEVLGYLPTKYNFLKPCMDDGYNYEGVVTSSTNTPVASITVDIAAQ